MESGSTSQIDEMPVPWQRPGAVDSEIVVDVAHFTDPLCPWAYSFEPVLRTLEARYGTQLRVRTVLIGLRERVEQAVARGATPLGRALSNLEFRRLGMPITPHVRPRELASGPACRLVVAARRQSEAAADALLRLLRLAWFTTDLLLDEPDGLGLVASLVAGLDVSRALADADRPEVRNAYDADREEARSPATHAVTMGRTARSDGPERYTAPTLVISTADGGRAVVPGFQPFEAAEVALLNLAPELARRPVPPLPALLAEYPGGLTSAEVARVLADTTDVPDRRAAEAALTQLVGHGGAERLALGDDALWRLRR